MQIRTFAPVNYKGIDIFVRNFGWEWEYLCVIDGRIYPFHLTIRPDFLNRVLCFFRFQAMPYSDEQLQGAVKRISQTAEITIDSILNPPPTEAEST